MTATPNLLAAAPDLYSATAAWLEYLEGDGEGGAAQERSLLQAMHAATAKARARRSERAIRLVVAGVELCGKCRERWIEDEAAALAEQDAGS